MGPVTSQQMQKENKNYIKILKEEIFNFLVKIV